MRKCMISLGESTVNKFSSSYSTRGFYLHHKAIIKRQKEGLTQELVADHMQSAAEYLKAASCYPPDDEKHACKSLGSVGLNTRKQGRPGLNLISAGYIHIAFTVQNEVGGPVPYLFMIVNKLHDAIPRMKPIWEFSADAKSGAHAALAATMKVRDELLRVAEGRTEEELSRMVMKCENV